MLALSYEMCVMSHMQT